VTVEDAAEDWAHVDAAYQTKYGHRAAVDRMTGDEARRHHPPAKDRPAPSRLVARLARVGLINRFPTRTLSSAGRGSGE